MNGHDAIPFLDLVAPHVELERELTEMFKRALHTASFIGGPLVEQFERSFADFCGVDYCVGASNGTDALRFALMAAGVKAGEIAITVPNTFIATVEAIASTVTSIVALLAPVLAVGLLGIALLVFSRKFFRNKPQ